MSDEPAILSRVTNAAVIAAAEWEAEHRVALTKHERELFIYAFTVGIGQGVIEARRANENA